MGIFQVLRHEKFLHRKVRKLCNLVLANVDNGNQTGACGLHDSLGVLVAAIWVKFGNPSHFRINLDDKDLPKFLNAKLSKRHREALEDTMCVFRLLFRDVPQYAFVGFVQVLGQILQSTWNVLQGAVAESF